MSQENKRHEFPWRVQYDQQVPHYLSYPEETVDGLFRKSVQKNSGEVALIYFNKKMSYSDLGNKVERLAGSLQKLGIDPGDRVALLLANCPQYVIAYYAILAIGGVVVPVNPLSTESELLHIFRDAQVKAAICLDLLAERLENVRDICHQAGETQLLKHTFYTALNEYMPFPLKFLYPFTRKLSPGGKERLKAAGRFKDLLNEGNGPVLKGYPSQKVDVRKDIAVLIYTGGTTGRPKGVMLSHYGLLANAYQAIAWVQMGSKDRLVTVLPAFHGFGMSVCMNAPLFSGASTILIPRFEAKDVLKAIHKHKPTYFAGVPTMYIGMINYPQLKRYSLSSLVGCFVGAAALAPEVKRSFEELTGARLMEGYGLTEGVNALCCNPLRGENRTGSIGFPFPDVDFKIRDIDTGEEELPPGESGELVIQCPDLMLGYYNRPEETAYALRDGWLYTGDIATMDEDGYFYLVDRKKDMIITGGFNVYPREVEDVLYEHPAVREACVIGVKDGYSGEKVVAFVSLKDGAAATEQDVIAFCRKHLVPYKVPKTVEFRTDLPKTAIGKILRRALRDIPSAEGEAEKSSKEAAATK